MVPMFRNDTFGTQNETTVDTAAMAGYEALLLAKRELLSAAAGEVKSPVPSSADESGDLMDWARADAEAELQVQRSQSESHLMRAIDEALGRIRSGRFGVCELCKQPIARARLEAVPWTRVCRDCKESSGSDAGDNWE
jgi:DnaK suppressor protein